MKEFYCKVSNGFTSFKLRCVRHLHIESENKLKVNVKIDNEYDANALMDYVRHFSESVTGRHLFSEYHNKLISTIVIENGVNSISFNRCMLETVNFPELINHSNVYGCEFELIFREAYRAKKLYLSGPMSICKDEATWKANFQKYEDIFTAKGYHVVNPAKNEILPTYEECLKHSLQQEMECDCIFFMPNSILSNGARLEYDIAKGCGLEIVLLDDDISFTDNYENNSGIKCKNC